MFKGDYIKKLHELGVRYCEKQGYGNVKLEHLKNYQEYTDEKSILFGYLKVGDND